MVSSFLPDKNMIPFTNRFTDEVDIGLILGMICDEYVLYAISLAQNNQNKSINVSAELHRDNFLSGIEELVQNYRAHVPIIASRIGMDEEPISKLLKKPSYKTDEESILKRRKASFVVLDMRDTGYREDFAGNLVPYLNRTIQ